MEIIIKKWKLHPLHFYNTEEEIMARNWETHMSVHKTMKQISVLREEK